MQGGCVPCQASSKRSTLSSRSSGPAACGADARLEPEKRSDACSALLGIILPAPAREISEAVADGVVHDKRGPRMADWIGPKAPTCLPRSDSRRLPGVGPLWAIHR